MTNFILHPKFAFSRIADGNGYFVSKILTVPASGSTNIHIRNSHTDKWMWLAAIDITVTGDHHIMMHDWFNSITDGDEIVIQNALLDSEGGPPDSGPFEAFFNTTFDATENGTVPIGLTEASMPSTNLVSYFPTVVQPSRQIVLDIQNQSDAEETGIISVLLCTSY